MSADIVLRAGDERPILRRTLRNPDGTPIDLTGSTVKINISDTVDGVLVVDETAEIVSPATDGVVDYRWEVGAPPAGVYFVSYNVTEGSISLTVPNGTPLSMLVTGTASWEYSYSNDPSKRDIDAIRFWIHDTNVASAVLTDKEIEFLVSDADNKWEAAADASVMIAGFYSALLDKKVGPLSISYGETAKRYYDLAEILREKSNARVSFKAVNTASGDSEPIFEIGMNDYPGSLLPPWQANQVAGADN